MLSKQYRKAGHNHYERKFDFHASKLARAVEYPAQRKDEKTNHTRQLIGGGGGLKSSSVLITDLLMCLL